MTDVVFVTGNPEKAAHFARHIGMDIAHQPADLDEIQTLNAAELVGRKVRQAYEQIGQPVLVEDVTFVYEAWDELPGPFVKFFTGIQDGPAKMCRMLDGFENRRAVAMCTFGYFDGHELKLFSSEIGGEIAGEPRGSGGYGFDRIFEPEGFGGRTAAELDAAEYDQYYLAVKPFAKVREFLGERDNQ